MPLSAPDVLRLFSAGSFYDCGDGLTATVTELPETTLYLPSGRVTACDPFIGLGDEVGPFSDEAEPGTYTVTVSIVELAKAEKPDYAHERVAAAWLQVSTKPTTQWTLALSGDQDLAELEDSEFFGYGVDAGTGCFVDASTTTQLADFLGEDGDRLVDALFDTEASTSCKPVALTDPDSGFGIVAFSSGWGDGAYPTWVGRSAAGEVTGFVTEFFVVPQPGRADE